MAKKASSSVGPFSHAKDNRSSASKISKDRFAPIRDGFLNGVRQNAEASLEISHGYNPSFNFPFVLLGFT